MIEKYKRSQYLKEYNEIIRVYDRQMKPLKNPFLIVFVSIYTLIGTVVFVSSLIYYLREYFLSGYIYWSRYRINRIIDFFIVLALIIFFVPETYFIRLKQINRHKERRLKNLEEKKAQAISAGIYDADV